MRDAVKSLTVTLGVVFPRVVVSPKIKVVSGRETRYGAGFLLDVAFDIFQMGLVSRVDELEVEVAIEAMES